MRTFLIAACGAALALFLASCGRPSVPLSGTITDDYTGRPVPNATVVIGEDQLATDAAGSYLIANWEATDTLQVRASGYEPLAIALETQAALATPEPPAATLNMTIRPNTLSGLLRDSYTGAPVAGATVRASDAISATTGADGRYTLIGLPESFALTIEAPGYAQLRSDVARSTSFDAELRPDTLAGIVTDRFTGAPVAGATVRAGTAAATTGEDGSYLLEGVEEEFTVTIEAPGYAALSQAVQRSTALDAVLRPDVISAQLINSETNEPVRNATIIATPSLGAPDVAFTRMKNSDDGQFRLEGAPEQGYVQILAPGYRKAVVEIKPGAIPATIALEPFTTRAVYITSAVASNERLLTYFFDLIDRTELNAIVIDIKSDLRDDLGLIYYDSQVPIVRELGTSQPILDLPAILAEAKRRNIYTIARVHMFSHDNVLADARPDWAARDRTTGGVFADYPAPTIRYTWLDPWNRNVWDYNIQLSVEAAQLGFDEINYDYIRFPSLEFDPADKERLQLSREGTTEEKYANIAEVLELSHRAINGVGAYFSVDVFGYTVFRPSELIGQNIEIMAEHTDYVCPMIYPSHYASGDLGHDLPARYPFEVITSSIERGNEKVAGRYALLRPWLQDFTLVWVPQDQIVEYGAAEVRAQIRAVEENGETAGWILYDSANTYTEDALLPAE
jgi:hypothetical protein